MSIPSPRAAPAPRRRTGRAPTAPTIVTRAPSRAAATAWLAPLPPPWREKRPPRDGLAGRGQPLGDHHQVGVDGADDDEAGDPRAQLRRPCSPPRTYGEAAAAPSGTGRHSRARCGRNLPSDRGTPGRGGEEGGTSCRFAVAPYRSWRSSLFILAPAAALAGGAAGKGHGDAVGAPQPAPGRHGPELLLRHGRPVRERRHGERQRRPAARQGRRPVRLRPDRQGLLPRRRPEGPHEQDRLHQGPRHDRASGSRRASRTRPSSPRTTRPATTATGSPTSPRSTRTWAPTRTCARSSTPRTRAGSRSTSTSSPTTRPT